MSRGRYFRFAVVRVDNVDNGFDSAYRIQRLVSKHITRTAAERKRNRLASWGGAGYQIRKIAGR